MTITPQLRTIKGLLDHRKVNTRTIDGLLDYWEVDIRTTERLKDQLEFNSKTLRVCKTTVRSAKATGTTEGLINHSWRSIE